MLIEDLDQLGKVRKRAGEPVDLVHHHDIDRSCSDVREQLLQGRAVERGAREAAIIIAVGDKAPALVGLALDIGLAGLALGIQGVELEIEVMLGRLAGVDRTAKHLPFGSLHGCRRAGSGDLVPFRREPGSAAGLLVPAGSFLTSVDPFAGTRRPKKRGPFQVVPVMARAMVERLGYVVSRQT